MNDKGLLTGWEDIAHYLGRGVRTAQRWERCLGLPVHRSHLCPENGAVFCTTSELYEWCKQAPLHGASPPRVNPALIRIEGVKLILRDAQNLRDAMRKHTSDMRKQTAELRRQNERLHETVRSLLRCLEKRGSRNHIVQH
jgi:hypothetical protein